MKRKWYSNWLAACSPKWWWWFFHYSVAVCLHLAVCCVCVCTRNTFITLSIQCGNVYNLNVAVIVLEIDNKERKLQWIEMKIYGNYPTKSHSCSRIYVRFMHTVIEWNISLFTNCAKMQTREIEKQPKYGEFSTRGTSQIGWSYIQIMHHSWIKHSYTYFIFIDVHFHYIFPIYSTLQRRIRITFWFGTFSIAYCERSWAISISYFFVFLLIFSIAIPYLYCMNKMLEK